MIKFGKDEQEREYILKAKIDVINQSYYEISDKRWHETRSVILIPDMEATETWRCFSEHLPEVGTVCLDCQEDDLRINAVKCAKCRSENIKTESAQLPAWISNPINSPCRVAFLRKNNYCPEHHIFVMSSGVEDELINMKGKNIKLVILKPSDDAVCDTAPSSTRTVK